MRPVNDVALVRRRQDLLAQLRAATATALARLWLSLDDYSDETAWTRKAGTVVTAGQNRAIDLQVAYLAALLGEKVTFDRAAVLAKARIDLTQPFIALALALSNGATLAAAVDAGSLRAEGVGESAVQWASRAANDAVDGHDRIVGWTRTLGPGACDWCQLVATQRYRSADSASFGHLRDNCGVDPIIGNRDPGRVLNSEFSPSPA